MPENSNSSRSDLTVNPHIKAVLDHLYYAYLRAFFPKGPGGIGLGYFLEVPTSEWDAKVRLMAEIIIALIFQKEKEKTRIKLIVEDCLAEIDSLYKKMIKGGGWRRGHSAKERQNDVMLYYDQHPVRFKYIKKFFLEELSLYDEGGGQEKRNFRYRLINKILSEEIKQTFKVREIFKIINVD